MDLKGCFSHNNDNWKTPSKLYEFYMQHSFIDVFPYMANYNEFEKNYYNQKLFINPPFSKMNEVVDWIIKQVPNNIRIDLLIPIRSDTNYFHKLLELNPLIWFIKGRLKYNDIGTAPFPSIIMTFFKEFKSASYCFGTIDEFMNIFVDYDIDLKERG